MSALPQLKLVDKENSSNEEALCLIMNVLQTIADTATDALHSKVDQDEGLCSINNLARDTIDALARRTVGAN